MNWASSPHEDSHVANIQFDSKYVLQNLLFLSKQIMTRSEKILAAIFKGLSKTLRLCLSDLSDSEDSVTPERLWKTLLRAGMRVPVHLPRISIQTAIKEWTQHYRPARVFAGAPCHGGDLKGRDTAGRSSLSPREAVTHQRRTQADQHIRQRDGGLLLRQSPIPVQHGHPPEWKLDSRGPGVSTYPAPPPTHRGDCLLGASHHSSLLPGASFRSSSSWEGSWPGLSLHPPQLLSPREVGITNCYHLDNANQ